MKNRHLGYFLNWILLGALVGILILFAQGRITFQNEVGIPSTPGHHSATSFASAVSRAAPSVVFIKAVSFVEAPVRTGDGLLERFLGLHSQRRTETVANSGSGVIMDDEGYILTNNHVIASADVIQVGLYDGRVADARVVGSDPETDLAVIKIDASNLPEIRLADVMSSRIGDIALAIGYPYEIGQTVTQGIISATGRSRVSNSNYENFIQTDAAINPGNSGGALINTNGEIIGINSLIYTKTGGFQGIGFAIPIDMAVNVLKQIKKNGYVVRGWLGVEGQEINPVSMQRLDLGASSGIILTSVFLDGPAEKAGLLAGDIITQINGSPITNVNDVMTVVAETEPMDVIEIAGFRDRQSFMADVVVGERPMMSQ